MEEIDTAWLEHHTCGLEKRIIAIGERAMRHTCLCEFIEGITTAELVYSLFFLHQRAEQGLSGARIVIQEFALEPFALHSLPLEQLKEAYTIAQERGWTYIASFFIGTHIKKPQTVDEFFTGNEFLDIPLGNRRQAARTQDRFLIDRLLHDRDHRVIALLLDNPGITEQDVVAIAARRPTQPKILLLISQHRKWASRYKIRKAIACNPYTPSSIAAQLLSTLMLQGLRFLHNSGALPQEIRDLAKKLLADRKALRGISTPQDSKNLVLNNTEEETDWETLFDEAHQALQNLGEIHDVETTSLQESESAHVMELDKDHICDEDELEALTKLAEEMLNSATLIPVGEDDS